MKFTSIIATLTAMFFSVAASAQLTHRDLLQKHSGQLEQWLLPQDKFHPVPQTAEEWRKSLPDSVVKTIIDNGEKALKKSFNNIPASVALEFARTGNRSHYEQLSFEKRNLLWDLVLAETLEDKGRFTDHIADGIWSICEESFWGASAHLSAQRAGVGLPDIEAPTVELFSAETAGVLALTDYLTGTKLDKVSKLIRPRIYNEVYRRIFKPMLNAKYGWMGGNHPDAKLNNWAPWIMSNYIMATLLLEKDQSKRLDAIKRGISITDQYINGLGADGGCDEGPGYWFAAGGATFDVLQELYDATQGKLNAYHEPFVQKIAAYIYKTHIAGNYFINVADAHPHITPDGIMIWRFGKAINDAQMAAFGAWAYHNLQHDKPSLDQFERPRILYNLLAAKNVATDSEKYTDVPDVWFSDIQLMASRTNNGLFVAAHGGNNGESHNHNDVGDFMLYADGYPVIIDVGSGTYTARTFSGRRYDLWFNTSPYHNLPTVNEQQQGAGLKYAATGVKYQLDKSKTTLSMDIKNAYPATSSLQKLQRTLQVNKSGLIIVNDAYSFLSPVKDLTQSFMTVCDADITQPGKINFKIPGGNSVILEYDKRLWAARKQKIDLVSAEDQGLKEGWDHRDIYRVLLTANKPTTGQTVKYIIHK